MRAGSLLTLAGLALTPIAARADVVRPTVVWTCQEEEGASFARFDLTESGLRAAGPSVVPVTGEGPAQACTLPWGVLKVEVVGYNSPGTDQACGAAQGWGLQVRVDERVMLDAPPVSATACHQDDFNPFVGWVQADQDSLTTCRQQPREGWDTATYDCQTVFADDL